MSLSHYSQNAGRLITEALAMLLGVRPLDYVKLNLVFAVQVRRETADGNPDLSPGVRFNNPLNLTTAHGAIAWPGQTGTYSGGSTIEPHGDFAAFGSIESGAWACAANYANGAGYDLVRTAFYAADPILLARAIENSPWDSGHYGYTLSTEVAEELGGHMSISREQYALEIEPLVKETIRVMIEQDGETREAILGLAPSVDTNDVIGTIVRKLTRA